MNDRTGLARDGVWENYSYDLNEQTTGGPDGIYSYDANGNRNDDTSYAVNNLNQYTSFGNLTLSYDSRGNTAGITGPTPTPYPAAHHHLPAAERDGDRAESCHLQRYRNRGRAAELSMDEERHKYSGCDGERLYNARHRYIGQWLAFPSEREQPRRDITKL